MSRHGGRGGCLWSAVLALLAAVAVGVVVVALRHAQVPVWWRKTMGNPVLGLLGEILVAFRGRLVPTLAMVAMAHHVLSKMLFLVPKTILVTSTQYFKQVQTVAMAGGRVHRRLRELFSDDAEKVGFYLGRLAPPAPGTRIERSCALGCGGCLLSSALGSLAATMGTLLSLAIFDSLPVLVGDTKTLVRLAASSSHLSTRLEALLPLPAQIWGISLHAHSIPLALLLGLETGVFYLARSISPSGHTYPRTLTLWTWIVLPIGILLAAVFLNGLYLLYAVMFQVVIFTDWILSCATRGIYLTLHGSVLRRRASRPPR